MRQRDSIKVLPPLSGGNRHGKRALHPMPCGLSTGKGRHKSWDITNETGYLWPRRHSYSMSSDSLDSVFSSNPASLF